MPALRHAYPSMTEAEIDDMPWASLKAYLRFEPLIGGVDG